VVWAANSQKAKKNKLKIKHKIGQMAPKTGPTLRK
jgi:hypothetical protein